jgi:hypothetical protein
MPRHELVKGFMSFQYRQVYKILQWKDGCIYKTKSIGYIKAEDEDKLDAEKYVCGSLSTTQTKLPVFDIPVFDADELE